MSKKHFELVAKAILLAKTNGDDIELLVNHLAEKFKEQNPRFDESKFLTACGF